jgi:hypothetical protein
VAFADDLLKDAHHLAARGGKNPKQSSLRRAVSTAYYALFHLLIADFTANWHVRGERARLGRMFEHRKMSGATLKLQDKDNPTPVEIELKKVISAFAPTGRAHRCKAKQVRRDKTDPTSGSNSYISTVIGARPEGKKISLVTTTGRCFFIIAQRSDCRLSHMSLRFHMTVSLLNNAVLKGSTIYGEVDSGVRRHNCSTLRALAHHVTGIDAAPLQPYFGHKT